MGGRSINDPFCGHSCYDDVMGPREVDEEALKMSLDPHLVVDDIATLIGSWRSCTMMMMT